jgi:hypothetical protein
VCLKRETREEKRRGGGSESDALLLLSFIFSAVLREIQKR